MKKSIIQIAVVVSCLSIVSTSNLFSQSVLFSNVKVTANWVSDPGIQADTLIVRPGGSSQSQRWLEMDIEYTARTMPSGWLDNVVFQYDVLLPKTTKRSVILSGNIEYWSIAMDGNKHYAQAFIHPRILQRYAPGLKMRKSELKDLRILLTVKQNGAPVGMGVYKPTTNADPKAIKAAVDKAMNSRDTYKGKDRVFGRDETPWGVLNVNRYELIKRKK